MASRHKAPTEVIIVQEEKSGFAQWVETNWKMGAVVAVAASGLIVGLQLKGDKELATEIGRWDQLAALVSSGDGTSVAEGADALPNPLRDIALLNAASMHAGSSDFEAALADLARIGSDTPLLTQLQLPAGPLEAQVEGLLAQAQQAVLQLVLRLGAQLCRLHRPLLLAETGHETGVDRQLGRGQREGALGDVARGGPDSLQFVGRVARQRRPRVGHDLLLDFRREAAPFQCRRNSYRRCELVVLVCVATGLVDGPVRGGVVAGPRHGCVRPRGALLSAKMSL